MTRETDDGEGIGLHATRTCWRLHLVCSRRTTWPIECSRKEVHQKGELETTGQDIDNLINIIRVGERARHAALAPHSQQVTLQPLGGADWRADLPLLFPWKYRSKLARQSPYVCRLGRACAGTAPRVFGEEVTQRRRRWRWRWRRFTSCRDASCGACTP